MTINVLDEFARIFGESMQQYGSNPAYTKAQEPDSPTTATSESGSTGQSDWSAGKLFMEEAALPMQAPMYVKSSMVDASSAPLAAMAPVPRPTCNSPPDAKRTPLRSKAAAFVSTIPAMQPMKPMVFEPQVVVPKPPVCGTESSTTVMMRNFPYSYKRENLLLLLDSFSFHGSYDFVYLPLDYDTKCNLGYAFVNLTSPGEARRFMNTFEGCSSWIGSESKKVCSVCWAEVQGQRQNVDRLRNHPVMSVKVPEEFKPFMFKDGERVPFPQPTKKIRPPMTFRGVHGEKQHSESSE